jgi:hypothetical protein
MSNFLAEKVACYANFLSIAVQGEEDHLFQDSHHHPKVFQYSLPPDGCQSK